MDKNKKKKKSGKKSKPVSSANPRKHPGDNVPGSDDSTIRVGSSVPEDHDAPPENASNDSDLVFDVCKEAEDEKPVQIGNGLPRAVEEETGKSFSLEELLGISTSEIDSRTHDRGYRDNGDCDRASMLGEFESEQMQALNIQIAHNQALTIEKEETGIEMKELQEALLLERETSYLLRDQITYLQGQIAESEDLQVSTRSEIERLRAENAELQGLIGNQANIQKLTAEIERLTAENSELQCLGDLRVEADFLTKEIERLTAESTGLHSLVGDSQAEIMRLITRNVELQSMVCTQDETELLREKVEKLVAENMELQSLAVNSGNEIKMLEEERKQLTVKMLALQNGMEQLERKASIRARVGEDLTAAADSTKRWEGWTVKDPLAIAAAVAEESRLQKQVLSQTLERLLEENDGLIKKINEQAAVINDLTQQCKLMADAPRTREFEMGVAEQRHGTGFGPEVDVPKAMSINGHVYDDIVDHEQEKVLFDNQDCQTVVKSPIKDIVMDNYPLNTCINSPKHVPEEEQEVEEQEVVREDWEIASQELEIAPQGPEIAPQETEIVPQAQEIVLVEGVSVSVKSSTNSQYSEQRKPRPVSDSKIIRAPFRLISFVAGYISGKDLVKD